MHGRLTLLIVISVVLAATAADRDPPQRNRDLELAVVDRLLDEGFGRTSRIIAAPNLQVPFFEAPTDYTHRWAQSAQDRRMQQEIARQLQEAIPGGRDLYALVQNGQAFLFGRVRNRQQHQRAEAIARDLKGIAGVENRIIVAEQGWTPQEDSAIEEAIREGLSRSPFVDSDAIDVNVDRGVAVISGTVDDFSKLLVAVERAFGGGARASRIQLQIARQADRTNGPPASAPSGLP
jgi:hypothetical protein